MSLLQGRGGYPQVERRTSIDTDGIDVQARSQISFLKVRNKGSEILRVFFTKADFDDDANYVEAPVTAANNPNGEWEGPVELDYGNNDERNKLWLKSAANTTDAEIVFFHRRG